MKTIAIILGGLLFVSCGKSEKRMKSIEMISVANEQDAIFQNLIYVTNKAIPEEKLNDSLAFLILPVQASCPSCRKKTIDSIVKYRERLEEDHFIIISANGGRKLIGSYFKEEGATLPEMANRLFLDSTNQADKYELYDAKPTMYYTYNRKAYKKVSSIPVTVRDDLQEFFSGHRTEK